LRTIVDMLAHRLDGTPERRRRVAPEQALPWPMMTA
jgi:hypothetical protein